MKKKHLPLEKDVDIEFEYKVYMVLDYLKKYYKPLLAIGVAIIVGIVAFYLYQKNKEETYNRASAVMFEISNLYANEKYESAEKLIKRFKEQFSDTPYVKLADAYSILIMKAKNENTKKIESISNELKEKLKTKHLKSAFTEFESYLKYRENNYQSAIELTKNVKQEHFNYISAATLRAFAFKKLGKDREAKQIFEEISQTSPYQYFKLVARENL